MKYFVPTVLVPEDIDPGFASVERLGGQPWGLAQHAWPICSYHRKPQSLLAQFAHHPDRLNLGGEGRMLFVFQCNNDPGMCDTWIAHSGCNACFVLLPHELIGTPADTACQAPEPADGAVVITSWQEYDDGIPDTLVPLFLNQDEYMAIPILFCTTCTASRDLAAFPRGFRARTMRRRMATGLSLNSARIIHSRDHHQIRLRMDAIGGPIWPVDADTFF